VWNQIALEYHNNSINSHFYLSCNKLKHLKDIQLIIIFLYLFPSIDKHQRIAPKGSGLWTKCLLSLPDLPSPGKLIRKQSKTFIKSSKKSSNSNQNAYPGTSEKKSWNSSNLINALIQISFSCWIICTVHSFRVVTQFKKKTHMRTAKHSFPCLFPPSV